MKLQLENLKLCASIIFVILYSTMAHSEGISVQKLEDRLNKAYEEKTLNEFGIEINGLVKQSPDSPRIWYIKGLWYKAMARQQYHANGKINDNTVVSFIQKKNEAIKKAMELDHTNEPHLTAEQYHRIASGLPVDLKLEAYRQELKFDPIGEYPQMRDTVYGRMLSTLYDAGRYEEAIELVNQMVADPKWLTLWKKPDDNVLAMKEKITRFEQKIKDRKSTKEINQVVESVKSKVQTPTVKSMPLQPTKPTIPKVEPASENADNRLWYMALGVLILLVVVVGVLVRKRRQ